MFDKYVLYVKTECPFCVQAIDLIEEKGFDYSIIEVDDCTEGFISQIKDAFNHDTFPMIMGYDDTYESYNWIGGYDNLIESFDE